MTRVYTRIAGGFLGAVVAILMLMTQANQPQDVGYIKPLTTPDPVAELIDAHDCWTDAAPADMVGKFPAHAIVGGKYVGKRLTDQAFDQAIGGHDHGLTVSAFCR
jgi:hypothetical protein